MRLIKCVLVRIAVGSKCVRLLDWSGLRAKLFRVLSGPQNRAGSLARMRLFLKVIGGKVRSSVPLSSDPEEL